MNERLQSIIAGAYTDKHRIMSTNLSKGQHICAHASGDVIVWTHSDTMSFRERVEVLKSVSPAQFQALKILHAECDAKWKAELASRSLGSNNPLRFERAANGVNWEANLGSGKIIIMDAVNDGCHFCSSFGPDSDKSFAGFMPGCDQKEAREMVHLLLS